MSSGGAAAPCAGEVDYFGNHTRARRFPWTLYHRPLEEDLARFLSCVAAEHPRGEVLVVGCGLLHELDAAPLGLRFFAVDVDPRAAAAVQALGDPRLEGVAVVEPELPLDLALARAGHAGRRPVAIYAKEVVEHVRAWPGWLAGLRRALVPGGRLWLSTPNYGEPWLPALEATALELVARRSGFSRRDLHPSRFSRRLLQRGLTEVGFLDISVRPVARRLALAAWARAPCGG